MLASMPQNAEWMTGRHVDDVAGIGLARVALPFASSREIARSKELTVVLDGELYEDDKLNQKLSSPGILTGGGNQAETFLQLYRLGGQAAIAELHGSFSAAIWEQATRRLILVTDRFGTRPLYYAKLPDRLLFASHIKPLLLDPELSREPNWNGLAQFFTFGHYLRDDTSIGSVCVLPAAAWAIFDAAADRFTIDRYNRLTDSNCEGPTTRPEALAHVERTFCNAVQRRVAGTHNLGLSLSGGLDARTILGVMGRECSDLQTVCLGMAGSQDHRASSRLAALVGCRHHNHVLDKKFLASFSRHLHEMVRLTDGQYLSQCIVMPTFGRYRDLGIEALLRGHAGELMHMRKAYNYSLDDEALVIRDRTQLEDWLWRRLQAHMLQAVDRPLFAGPLQQEMASLARRSLRSDLEETAADGPIVQQIWRLFVHQRLRRETVLSLMKFRSVVEPRLPYLDNELVPLLLSLPPEMKLEEEMQSQILARRRPSFLKVTNTNTGAKLGASRWSRRLATVRMKAFAKLGVPGYQPYERLGLWLRRQLSPLLKEILLGPRCLDRGVFEPNGVRRVVAQHLAGRNHTYLLLAMMIFEVGQRHLEDASPADIDAPVPLAAAS
jgi:asparagine synthase (glutamine-hydrolysing)